jgi:hypothetical protein
MPHPFDTARISVGTHPHVVPEARFADDEKEEPTQNGFRCVICKVWDEKKSGLQQVFCRPQH